MGGDGVGGAVGVPKKSFIDHLAVLAGDNFPVLASQFLSWFLPSEAEQGSVGKLKEVLASVLGN